MGSPATLESGNYQPELWVAIPSCLSSTLNPPTKATRIFVWGTTGNRVPGEFAGMFASDRGTLRGLRDPFQTE